MSKEEQQKRREFSQKELQDVLEGVKELSKEDLDKIFGGVSSQYHLDPKTGKYVQYGDERETFTRDAKEIERDIFGSKMFG